MPSSLMTSWSDGCIGAALHRLRDAASGAGHSPVS
jgi:hypothetical protein